MTEAIQTRLMHLLLTLVMGWAVATLTDHREALFLFVFTGWLSSIFIFEKVPPVTFRRLAGGTLLSGVLGYLFCKFVLR